MGVGSALSQQATRREVLIQILLSLIILAGLTFFTNWYAPRSANVANVSKIGPAGPAGAMGPQGLQGLIGPAGADGAQGATGATGVSGMTGPTGATGLAGAAGATGATGPQGPTGPAGTLSSHYASYYYDGLESIPSSAAWIIGFPTQAVSHGSHVAVNNNTITLSAAGTYLITASGSLQMSTFENSLGELRFDIVMRQSVQGGAYANLLPDPMADYDIPGPESSGGVIVAQTFNVSRLVTVTSVPVDIQIVLNNNSYNNGGMFIYNRLLNIVQID